LINENFHYGSFSRFWWRENDTKKENGSLFPIRIGQKTATILNEQKFIVTVAVGYPSAPFLPGYQCYCGSIISEIVANPSTAISTVYANIFKNKTRVSGPLVIGWTNEKIISQLLFDIIFYPFFFSLNSKMQIFVFGIGMSSHQNLSKGESGFKSSLICKHNSKHTLFVSTIDNDLNCLLEIYQEFQLIKHNSTTQLYINQHKVPICTFVNWNNYDIMKKLFDYHLKRRIIADILWYQFFINWVQNENETIELVTSLQKIYLTHYQFSEREFSTWKTLIRAVGGFNITLWPSDESEVIKD
ncbi:13118_t:CDS:2, partial [Cetraspora pellucida]